MPFPPGMVSYETAPENQHLGTFIERHPSMNGEDGPNHDGKRVAIYECMLQYLSMNDCLVHIFLRSQAHYDYISDDSVKDSLLDFNNICTSAGS